MCKYIGIGSTCECIDRGSSHDPGPYPKSVNSYHTCVLIVVHVQIMHGDYNAHGSQFLDLNFRCVYFEMKYGCYWSVSINMFVEHVY